MAMPIVEITPMSVETAMLVEPDEWLIDMVTLVLPDTPDDIMHRADESDAHSLASLADSPRRIWPDTPHIPRPAPLIVNDKDPPDLPWLVDIELDISTGSNEAASLTVPDMTPEETASLEDPCC